MILLRKLLVMKAEGFSNKLIDKGLKVTPQRIAILEAIVKLNNHPTAENIIEYIRKNHPNIATATVYKVLDALVSSNLIRKVKTERDVMRYDAVMENHHHLYCSESDRIEDYNDNELNELLEKYFETKGIPDFKIEDIKLQIIGTFVKNK
jgi:Fur family transcriptional regulator, peroxide stress response regulator